MPIDLDRNIVFVHIPKTGGTSVEAAFDLSHREKLWSPAPVKGLRPENKTPQHFTYREIAKNVPRGFVEGAFKFAFVRNPWDRLVSEYAWRRRVLDNIERLQAPGERYYGHADLESLDAFVRLLELPPDRRIDNDRGFGGHLETQWSYLVDDSGALGMDFVGRFESFEGDLGTAAERIGGPRGEVPHLMKSSRAKDYRSYYTDYSRAAVASFYRDDIERFDYSF